MKEMSPEQQSEVIKDISARFSFLSTGIKTYDEPIAAISEACVHAARIAFISDSRPQERAEFLNKLEESFLFAKESYLRRIRERQSNGENFEGEMSSPIVTPDNKIITP